MARLGAQGPSLVCLSSERLHVENELLNKLSHIISARIKTGQLIPSCRRQRMNLTSPMLNYSTCQSKIPALPAGMRKPFGSAISVTAFEETANW